MLVTWAEVYDVNSKSCERYTDEFAPMAVPWANFAAEEANAKVVV
jgi:hypothetical protein